MDKVKATFRRPLAHHLAIWCYVLAPAANILLASVFLGVPAAEIVSRLARGFGPLAALLCLTAPLAGLGLYFAYRATWILFVAHAALVLADFAIKAMTRPLVLGALDPLNLALIVLGNGAMLGIVACAFRRDVRIPYFTSTGRGFRGHRRLPVSHRITVDGVRTRTRDLSATGCFVEASGLEGAGGSVAGRPVTVAFNSGGFAAATRGVVVRVGEGGYGIRFVSAVRARRFSRASSSRSRLSRPSA
jgi:hypothetical protein